MAGVSITVCWERGEGHSFPLWPPQGWAGMQMGERWPQGTVTLALVKGNPFGTELVPAGPSLWLSTFHKPQSSVPPSLLGQRVQEPSEGRGRPRRRGRGRSPCSAPSWAGLSFSGPWFSHMYKEGCFLGAPSRICKPTAADVLGWGLQGVGGCHVVGALKGGESQSCPCEVRGPEPMLCTPPSHVSPGNTGSGDHGRQRKRWAQGCGTQWEGGEAREEGIVWHPWGSVGPAECD